MVLYRLVETQGKQFSHDTVLKHNTEGKLGKIICHIGRIEVILVKTLRGPFCSIIIAREDFDLLYSRE